MNEIHKFAKNCIVGFVGFVLVGYVAFQAHLLPDFLGKIISKIMFYPTLPLSFLKHYPNIWTFIDDKIIVGCAPIALLGHVDQLHALGVKSVINLCYEYPGPTADYQRLGITQLHLPTIDHKTPTLSVLTKSVEFIESSPGKVYIHCKAGHGRSAAVALAWLIKHTPTDVNNKKNDDDVIKQCNEYLVSKRWVRKNMYKQPSIIAYHSQVNNNKVN